MATTARAIMTLNPECVGEEETVLTAAQIMRDAKVEALPVCGRDNLVTGMITDRDVVVQVLAQGLNPATTLVGDLAQPRGLAVDVDGSVDDILHVMREHHVRCVPVIERRRLVGIVSRTAVTRALPNPTMDDLLEAFAAA